jgi:signal transduction histidine kinase
MGGRDFIKGIVGLAAAWPLAAVVGVAYFLPARLSQELLLQPGGVAVFWPAAGISSGILIALGPRARSPVATGVIVASIAVHYSVAHPLWVGTANGLANAAEALITAGLIERYFGADFSLERLRQVLGLLGAAIVGTVISAIGGAAIFRFFSGSSILTSWGQWFLSDVLGIIIVAPFIIGLTATVRQPMPRSELIEGTAALVVLTGMTGIISFLPREPWDAALPITWLLPILFWLSVRCRPVIAATAAFIVCFTIVSTTIYGIGYFGDLSLTHRLLGARASILFVALSANILAALFAERRDSEARLARSNAMLERERDNKLLNAQAITAAIAHEVSQPLGAIELNGEAGLDFLSKSPPDLDQIRSILDDVITAGRRTSEVIGDIHNLFGKVDHRGRGPVDVNELILGILRSLGVEFERHGVETSTQLTPELPLVDANRGQLQEVIYNLVRNSVEAMDTNTDRARLLRVRTELRGPDAISIAVEDTGRGIDPTKLSSIFDAFTTTKSDGMGLGLAICRMISESHGGQLTASSDGKSGSLFLFVLPITSIRGHLPKG